MSDDIKDNVSLDDLPEFDTCDSCDGMFEAAELDDGQCESCQEAIPYPRTLEDVGMSMSDFV